MVLIINDNFILCSGHFVKVALKKAYGPNGNWTHKYMYVHM